jgi:hypothetical protein
MLTIIGKAASGKNWLIALGALLSVSGVMWAADVGRVANSSYEPDIGRDVLHTVSARRALYQDAQLAPLNLGVKVHNRVAVLWGPVPSLELARRAVDVLKALPDLVRIQSELEIVPDEYRPLFLPDARRTPTGSTGTLTTRTSDQEAKTGPAESGWQANTRSSKDPRIPDHSEIDLVLPSLRVPTPPLVDHVSKTAEQAIRELRQQRRFADIGMEVKGTVVYLSDPNDSAFLPELARIISRLPGVDRVIVKDR